MKNTIKISLIVLFAIKCFSGFSQSELDSLKNLFEIETNANKRANISYTIGKLTYSNNPQICKYYLHRTIADSNSITDLGLLGENIIILGLLYRYQDNMDSANYCFIKCISIGNQINDQSLLTKANYHLALNYGKVGNHKKSIKLLIDVLKTYEENKNHLQSAWALHYIGNNYLVLNNNEMGLKYQKMVLQSIKKNDTLTNVVRSLKANTLNSIGLIYVELQNRDSAIYYFTKSLILKEEVNNLYGWCNTKLNMCNMLSDKSPERIACLEELLDIQIQIQDNAGIVKTKNNLALGCFKRGNYKQALQKNLDLLNNYKKYCSNEEIANLYYSISINYSKLNNFERAYIFKTKSDSLQDILRKETINSDILEVTEKYQSEKKDKEIANQKLEIVEKDIEIYNRNKILIGLSVSVLFLVFIGLYIMQIRKRKAQHEKDEAIIKEKNRGLAAVIQTQEDERKRIAKDLHDGIVQQLGGLKLGLQKVFADNETQETEKLVKILDDSADELRELSHKMMPRSLSELGLVPALEDMLENSLGNTTINYQFEDFGIKDRFEENIEIAIYRIAQELINNVIKHSKADKVNVQLFKSANDILLIVEDNGKGIDKIEHKEGIGLMNISSRLDTINGKVNYEPSPESGTLATIKIPLQQ